MSIRRLDGHDLRFGYPLEMLVVLRDFLFSTIASNGRLPPKFIVASARARSMNVRPSLTTVSDVGRATNGDAGNPAQTRRQ
jgi:hypothetical protein